MDFTIYPIKNSGYYNGGEPYIGDTKTNPCLNTNEYKPKSCKLNLLTEGYHKPLNEVCKEIHYNISQKDPSELCNDSPWNNMTRRISLVKDY